MKFATIKLNNQTMIAIVRDKDNSTFQPSSTIIDDQDYVGNNSFQLLPKKYRHFTIFDLIEKYDQIKLDLKNPSTQKIDITDKSNSFRLLAPIPLPKRNIFCVGKNYKDHIAEMKKSGLKTGDVSPSGPEHPIIFSKLPQAVIAHNAAIPFPKHVSTAIDYETEVGVIISKKAKAIPKNNVYDYVFGYTIINDVTARDLQVKHKQWLIGKSQDGFCPMGPYIVTKDELNPDNTELKCWVNGELRQSANTSQMIFDIPTIISTISQGITLYPGDIIATGTPSGVGSGFNPKKYLKPGDEIKMEIENIGTLVNRVEN